MEAISGRKTLLEIGADHSIHRIQVSQWKKQLLEGSSELFTRGRKSKAKDEGQAREAELFQQIGKLQRELEWLKNISILAIMARIDATYLEDPSDLEDPTRGSRRIVHYLAREGNPISRGRSTRTQGRHFQTALLSGLPGWWTSTRSHPSIRFGRRLSPLSCCAKDSCIWWRLLTSSPETFSAASFAPAWIPSSAWTRWNGLLEWQQTRDL